MAKQIQITNTVTTHYKYEEVPKDILEFPVLMTMFCYGFRSVFQRMIDAIADTTFRYDTTYHYAPTTIVYHKSDVIQNISLSIGSSSTYCHYDESNIRPLFWVKKDAWVLQEIFEKYRWSFNGKMKDDEVKGAGNSYDYVNRVYDTRLGRFLSIDPLTSDFPYYSTYQFAGNKPIVAIDIDGLEEYIVVTGYPNAVNGIVLIRVSKQFYIDDLNKRHSARVNNITSSYDYKIGNAKGKSKKELIAQKEKALSAAQYDYNQGLKKIDNNYSKTFYTKCNNLIESENALDGYIFAQGEMKDVMSANELEYFNGGGKILQELAGSTEWDKFLNTDIVSAMPGNEPPIGRIAYKAEAKWSTQTHFKSNSSNLVIEDQPFLDDIIAFLGAFENAKIVISGYTDSDGSESANQKLSEDRAKSAMDYLVGQGIDASRIEIKGYGESKATQGSNVSDEQKAADRKITIEVQQ